MYMYMYIYIYWTLISLSVSESESLSDMLDTMFTKYQQPFSVIELKPVALICHVMILALALLYACVCVLMLLYVRTDKQPE